MQIINITNNDQQLIFERKLHVYQGYPDDEQEEDITKEYNTKVIQLSKKKKIKEQN